VVDLLGVRYFEFGDSSPHQSREQINGQRQVVGELNEALPVFVPSRRNDVLVHPEELR